MGIDGETYVAEESLVEDMVDGIAIVYGALGLTHYAGAGSGI
jgi:hypothetical protein